MQKNNRTALQVLNRSRNRNLPKLCKSKKDTASKDIHTMHRYIPTAIGNFSMHRSTNLLIHIHNVSGTWSHIFHKVHVCTYI